MNNGKKTLQEKWNMNKKLLASVIVFTLAFGSPIQVLALQKASKNALTFFKRYESEFGNLQRRLEEYNRKLQQSDGGRAEDIKLDAQDLMDQVQRRYDLLEDQYSATIADYPQDGAELREGFGRIDDGYRRFRDYYNDNFLGKKSARVEEPKPEVVKPAAVVPVAKPVAKPVVAAQPARVAALGQRDERAYQEALAALRRTPEAAKAAEPVVKPVVQAAPAVAVAAVKEAPKVAAKAVPSAKAANAQDSKFLEALAVLKRGDNTESENKDYSERFEAKKAEMIRKIEEKERLEKLEEDKARKEALLVAQRAAELEAKKEAEALKLAEERLAVEKLAEEKLRREREELEREKQRLAAIREVESLNAAKEVQKIEEQRRILEEEKRIEELKQESERLIAERQAERKRLEDERQKLIKEKEEARQAVIARVLAEQDAKKQKEKEKEKSKFASALSNLRQPAGAAASAAGAAAAVTATAADTAVAKANTLAATVSVVASKAVAEPRPAQREIKTSESYKEALSVLKRDPVLAKTVEQAAYAESDEALVVAVVPAAREEIKGYDEQREVKEAVESSMDIANVLRAIEAKQAVEAEKIRSARKARALAEAEKARKEAELEALKAQREAERIAKRAALASDEDYGRLKMSGSVAFEFRDKEEKTKAQTLVGAPTTQSTLPNDLSQLRLILNYQTDEDHSFTLDERYLQRERNEKVRENYLTMAYMMRENEEKVWNIKNTFQTTSYPDAVSKDYRDNNLELSLNQMRSTNRESLTTVGYQVRSYPNYDRANFHQFALSDQETWISEDGIMFAEGKLESRKYRVVNDLDYDNANVYLEYSKSYENDAELTLSNSYDRRAYDKEAISLYRTSYYDNFLRMSYTLPMHSVLTYVFEAQHNKHEYGSDKERGYSELDLFAAAKMKLTQKTRAQLDYRFVDNDENSKNLAHKNNMVHLMVQKNVNETLRFRFDHTYHNRDTVVGKAMNFDDHDSLARLMWRLNNVNITWKTGFNSRIHDETSYVDYRYYYTGLDIGYQKPKQYEWRIRPSVRKMEFRNFYQQNKLDPIGSWEDEIQPSIEVEYIKPLKDDLKLTLTATHEKTFYRTYDSYMQDLLWNFAKPMVNSEIVGKLEQSF
jgi:hypothetical protein